jgi:hypothetical protein
MICPWHPVFARAKEQLRFAVAVKQSAPMPPSCLRRVFAISVPTALLALSAVIHAAEPDFTIELGKRVGAITKSTTLAQLKEAYGAKNVKRADLPGPEGTTLKGAIVFAGGEREMHVIWNDEKPEKEVFDVRLFGASWVIAGKLKLGASIADVEAANGGPFKISGFNWDLGGFANFEGGKLARKVMVRFEPSADADESLSGDKQISSDSKKLRAAKPLVTKLFVVLR